MNVEAQHVEMDLDTAIPCALIIHELVSNALKHAFPPDRLHPGLSPAEIDVSLKRDGIFYSLEVSDNGIGMPPGLDTASTRSLGLRLIRMLGEHQLGGKIKMETCLKGGTRFVFHFKTRDRRENKNDQQNDPYC